MAYGAMNQDEIETAIRIVEQIPFPDRSAKRSRELVTEIAGWFAVRGDEEGAFSASERMGAADCWMLASDFAATARVHAVSRAIDCAEGTHRAEDLLARSILDMAHGAHYDEMLQLARMQEKRSKALRPAAAMVLAMAAADRSDEVAKWLGYLDGAPAVLALTGAAALLKPSSPLKRSLGQRALAITASSENTGRGSSIWYHAGRRLTIADQPDLVLEASNKAVDEKEISELRAMAAWSYARQGSIRLAVKTIDLIPMKSWKRLASESVLRYSYGLPPNDGFILSSVDSEKMAMGEPYRDQG